MAMRIRFQYPSGNHIGYSVERLSDGLLYDFVADTFVANSTTPILALPEDTGIFVGRYKATLPTPAAQFTDGDYAVTIHHIAEGNAVVAELAMAMHSGDDATYFPAPFPAPPWSITLPGPLTLAPVAVPKP
jgi:hypothetical protein